MLIMYRQYGDGRQMMWRFFNVEPQKYIPCYYI